MEYNNHRVPSSSWVFKQNADNFFWPYMRSSPEIRSNAAVDFVHRYTEVLFTSDDNLKVFLNILLDIIVTFEGDSAPALNRILKLYADILDFIHSQRQNQISAILSDTQRTFRRMEAISEILENINKVYVHPLKYHHVLPIINSGNIFLMQVLLRNGLLHQLRDDYLPDSVQEFKSLYGYSEPLGDSGIHLSNGVTVSREIAQVIFRDLVRWRRITLSRMAVYALRWGNRRRAEGHAECLRLFFSTIPDDFVTLQELNDLLVDICDGQRDADLTVSVFMTRLEELFPESRGPREPRRLLHLCRLRINSRILESGRTLTGAISDLEISQRMKNYLLSTDEGRKSAAHGHEKNAARAPNSADDFQETLIKTFVEISWPFYNPF